MEIVRSQCAHAMPLIAKDRDRPRRVSNREISRPSDQATSDEDLTHRPSDGDEDRASSWPSDGDRATSTHGRATWPQRHVASAR